jgi:hypothetical protein
VRNLPLIAIAVAWGLCGPHASGAVPAALEPLTFLLGEWETPGQAGGPNGRAVFATSLQNTIIIRTSFAEYPASADRPASRHDDLMVIYVASRGGVRADYYDNEGHLIRYSVTSPRAGEASFISEPVAGQPRFRLTYRLRADGVLAGEFAMAPPGQPDAFASYLAWESRKAKAQ